MAGAHVNEVNVEAVDCRHELWESIQLCLKFSPIVVPGPIAHEFLQLLELRALRLVRDRFPVRPAGRRKASTQVDELFLGNIDAESSNCVISSRRGQLCGKYACHTGSNDTCNETNKAAATMVDIIERSIRNHNGTSSSRYRLSRTANAAASIKLRLFSVRQSLLIVMISSAPPKQGG